MYNDDLTNDVGRSRWLPAEGYVDVEIVKMVEATSKTGNPKFTIDFVNADNPSEGLQQDLTNIQGKRWLLRQLLEACGIEPEIIIDPEGEEHKIFNWDIPDVESKTICAKVEHEPNDWIDRNNVEHHDKRAKFVGFKKLEISKEKTDWLPEKKDA